jgi:hypothetical protein
MHWTTHTLRISESGDFYGECGRDSGDGIDPYMKLYWDHALLKEQIEKIRSDNAEEIDRLKREHGTELDGQKQQLQQLRIDLQSANARVRKVDEAVKSETMRVQSALEEAHKAALGTRLKALEQAHETVLQGRQTVLDELQNRYDALTTQLRATESAKAKAERQARLALSEEEMARSELKRAAAELKELKSMLAQLGGADSIRMLRVIQWYKQTHGPIPSDVEMQILAGLEVVPSTESAVSEVVSTPADDSVVAQGDNSTDEDPFVSDSHASSLAEPVDEAQTEPVNDEVGATTDSEIELSLHGSRVVGIDDILAELDAQPGGTDAQAPMQCESPEGCVCVATKVATPKFPNGEELEVLACDACAASPGPFLPVLKQNGIQLVLVELIGLFIDIDPHNNILTTSTPNHAQEASHHA